MKTFVLLIGLVLVGCGADFGGGGDDTSCAVTLSYTPTQPIAAPDTEVRVTSVVSNAFGTPTFTWHVTKGGLLVPFTDAASNHSEISFLATESGTFDVTLDVSSSSGLFCPQGQATVNVLQDLMGMKARLHVTPPQGTDAPLIDRPLQIHDATDFDMGPVVLEPGVIATGQIRSGTTNVPAYLMFTPQGMPGAMIETFTSGTGGFSVRLLDQAHDVIVVPMIAGQAPQRVSFTPGSTVIALANAQAFSGTVRQGTTKISGAKVQLTIDGVPTTLATTDSNGAFQTLGITTASGETVKIEVTPPAGSGLPRLEATDLLQVTQAIDVNYTALTLRNLQGVPVRRGGAAQTGKKIAIVGTIGSAGTITAGISTLATGFLRISTTTDAAGVLPSVLAPAGPLFAVTTVAPGDLAVGTVDLTSGVPLVIDAPQMTAFATDAFGATDAIPGATLDLIPSRALELAGATALHFIADGSGHVTGQYPTNGAFDVRWSDPAGERAPFVKADVTQLQPTYVLPPAVYISGDLTVTGSSNPIVGASVQVLCAGCTGLDKNRPIAEVASDPHGSFTLAVPDPGAL